jgi:hypothetical protein
MMPILSAILRSQDQKAPDAKMIMAATITTDIDDYWFYYYRLQP